MRPEEIKKLEEAAAKIIEIARGFGLDFYDIHFEICPAEVIYAFGAYGMPTRFSHWVFGKYYHKMKTQYDYNLSRIYELVINSNPCYAFLLDGNSLLQNKLVIAHVVAHCDFFKNNAYFRHTNRNMLESMAVAAERFRRYEFQYGREKVEKFLDAVIGIQEHIEPYPWQKGKTEITVQRECRCSTCRNHCPSQRITTPYDDLWHLDERGKMTVREEEGPKKFPPQPEKDLLAFIMYHSRDLEDWQRDIIAVIRQEMQYFWPQMETKIINEGWATYWHLRIMRELDLPEDEAIEFAKMHAGVVQPSRLHLNPYFLGLKIFEDIEKRWDNPTAEEKERYGRQGGEGRAKIFEVREIDNDISFIRNYLTDQLIEELDLFVYKKFGYEWKIVEKDPTRVRENLLASLVNCGHPYIVVEDGDYNKRGELYLRHVFEGVELDIYYTEKTLPYVYQLWGRPVHLETILDGKKVIFTCEEGKISRRISGGGLNIR